MFANDTKIYHPMTSHEDTTILQNDIECLQSWSAKWLNFNLHNNNKYKIMSITKSTACNHDIVDYFLKITSSNTSSTPIHCCSDEIYLGVVFQSNLSFRNHIPMSINKTNKLLAIIRSFCAMDNTNITLFYKAVV